MASGLLFVVFAFLADRGFYEIGIYLSLCGIAWQAVTGKTRLVIPAPLVYLMVFYALFILQGTLLSGRPFSKGAMSMVYACVLVVAYLQVAVSQCTSIKIFRIAFAIVVAFLFVNFIYDVIPNGNWRPKAGIAGTIKKIGYFRNAHWAAQAALLVFPFLVYLSWLSGGIRRFLYLAFIVICLMIIGLTNAAAAFLALAGVLLVLAWYLGGSGAQRGLRVAFASVALLLVASYYYADGSYFQLILAKIAKDERWMLWQISWRLQEQSTLWQWIFGHGFEVYGQVHNTYAIPRGFELAYCQHNMVLEVLYSNGVVGLLVLLGFLVAFLRYLHGILSVDADGALKVARVVVVASFYGLLIDAMFVYPFVSREFQLPFALIAASAIYLSPAFISRFGGHRGFFGRHFAKG
jgi:O-antigen ligase